MQLEGWFLFWRVIKSKWILRSWLCFQEQAVVCFHTSCNKKKRQQSSQLGRKSKAYKHEIMWFIKKDMQNRVIFKKFSERIRITKCLRHCLHKQFTPEKRVIFFHTLVSYLLRGKIQISFHFRYCPHLHYHRNHDYWFSLDKGWFMNISERTKHSSCLFKNAALSNFTLFANDSKMLVFLPVLVTSSWIEKYLLNKFSLFFFFFFSF